VLRDAPDVSAATKHRIRQLADEMGYVPDALARGLRTRRTKLFGLVVPSLSHWQFGPAATAIQDRAHELGYDVLIAQTQDAPGREELSIRRLLARRVDGLFVAPVYRLGPTATIYDELAKADSSVVILGHHAPFCSGFPAVETDDAQASRLLAQHLITLGHRQIAYFAGPPAVPAAQEHLEGYRRALREADISFDDRLIFTAGSNKEDGSRAAEQMLSEGTMATAVQTTSDLVAAGAAAVFRASGYCIPEDLSMVGFGDHPVAELMSVALSTARTPKYALGVAAVEQMLRLLQEDSPGTKRLVSEILYRASTAAPPNVQTLPRDNLSRVGVRVSEGDDLE
jgi:DNA-binding LacI/PurR family transcriptional regulator